MQGLNTTKLWLVDLKYEFNLFKSCTIFICIGYVKKLIGNIVFEIVNTLLKI